MLSLYALAIPPERPIVLGPLKLGLPEGEAAGPDKTYTLRRTDSTSGMWQ